MDHPSLTAKIDNHEAARPQVGLDRTDIVFEELVEGGLTRYAAVWHYDIPNEIGPVRSIRPMDPDIISPFGGLVAYSGGQEVFVNMMMNTPVRNLVFDYDTSGIFYRYDAHEAPHNVILHASDAVHLALDFYRERRAQHARVSDEGDGLLWQRGPDADATRFTIDLTRQLIREDAEPITQLSLCLTYRWTPARRALGRGHSWCFEPAAARAFEREIRASAAYRAVVSAVPVEVIVRTDVL
jgi:hypothetical protein